jgi:predicted nucleic acid-binding protein
LCKDDETLIQEVIHLSRRFNLKLPDVVIAAVARTKQAVLITGRIGISM